ncbi:hypothetical protein [Spiroplasma endosymbiont of Labia minor]|uniref:alpha/beta hydrolase n=1 Tax=Spiroplasma endosymbiont of Labia minor TaxID=3066305 RepID=UPI0030D61DD1
MALKSIDDIILFLNDTKPEINSSFVKGTIGLQETKTIKDKYDYIKRNYNKSDYDKVTLEWWEKFTQEKIPTADDVEIAIYTKKGKFDKKWIILFHDFKKSHVDSYFDALKFILLGYSVALVDFRNHGESQSTPVTLGWLEIFDVISVIDYVSAVFEAEEIGLFGKGLGGFIVCRTIDVYGDQLIKQGLKWTIIESAPSSSNTIVFPLLHSVFSEKRFITYSYELQNLYMRKYNAQILNIQAFTKSCKIPTMFLTVKNDSVINSHESQYLYNQKGNLNVDKNVLYTEGSHEFNWLDNWTKYWNQIIEWLQYLKLY